MPRFLSENLASPSVQTAETFPTCGRHSRPNLVDQLSLGSEMPPPHEPARRSNRLGSEATYQPSPPRYTARLPAAGRIHRARRTQPKPPLSCCCGLAHAVVRNLLVRKNRAQRKKVSGDRQSGRLILGKEQRNFARWRGVRPVLGQVRGRRVISRSGPGKLAPQLTFRLPPGEARETWVVVGAPGDGGRLGEVGRESWSHQPLGG